MGRKRRREAQFRPADGEEREIEETEREGEKIVPFWPCVSVLLPKNRERKSREKYYENERSRSP